MPRTVPSTVLPNEPTPRARPAAPIPGNGSVVSVSRDDRHRFTKPVVEAITLVEGWGVEGDAHAGVTVKHRSHAARRPEAPNLRQVHLLHEEVLDDVAARGFAVAPGEMGENITTRGIALLCLPTGTVVRLGVEAAVVLTGLRNPCVQIDRLAPGLMQQMITRDEAGNVLRRAGVMAVVLRGGVVHAGDPISFRLPDGAHTPLQPV